MKKFLALLLSLTLCFSLFAACGDNETEPKGDDEQNQTETNGDEKHFRTFISAEPSTLDVSRRADSYSSNIVVNTVEGLVRTKADSNGSETIPGDAESWEVSEDGLTWTFHLHENAKWEDGEPVTAEQYVYSLRRSSDPATGCPNAFFLQPSRTSPRSTPARWLLKSWVSPLSTSTL